MRSNQVDRELPGVKTSSLNNQKKVFGYLGKYITVFSIFLTILLFIGYFHYQYYYRIYRNKLRTSQQLFIKSEATEIDNVFRNVIPDAMFMAAQYNMIDKINAGEEKWDILAKSYQNFSRRKRIYDQIRVIDLSGHEVIRVNFNGGNPVIVDEEKLQHKGSRSYFINTMKCSEGELYVSRFDLNVERGKIETPIKPVIRFGTPLVDDKGNKKGILVLNYLASELISAFKDDNGKVPGDIMLVDSEGYWLIAPNPDDEWGFIFQNKKNRTFRNLFPEAWARMRGSDTGQFEISKGLFTYETIYPRAKSRSYVKGINETKPESTAESESFWKILSFIPRKTLNMEAMAIFLGELVPLYTVLVIMMAVISWIIVVYGLRNEEYQNGIIHLASFPKQNPDPVVEVDFNGRINYVNPKAEERYPDLEEKGMEHPLLQGFDSIIEKLDKGDTEVVIREITVDDRIYDQRIISLADVRLIRVFSYDITDIKETQRELLRARDAAEAANKAKSAFLAGMSHEFRTPLNSIIGFAQVLKGGHFGELNEDQTEYVKDIHSSGEHLLSLINTVIDFARIESGKSAIEIHPVSIQPIIERSFVFVKEKALVKNVEVTMDVPDDIPFIMSDERAVLQIMINLISNAVKFNRLNGSVKVTARLEGDVLVVQVEDTGAGIPEEDLEKIFNAFEQSTSRKANHEGTGLGLALVKKMCEVIDAQISVESEVGKGSTFTLKFPVLND